VNAAAKECTEQRVLSFQQEGNESVERIGQILSMFLDDSIADRFPSARSSGAPSAFWSAQSLRGRRSRGMTTTRHNRAISRQAIEAERVITSFFARRDPRGEIWTTVHSMSSD
jgi:hypothetical protein